MEADVISIVFWIIIIFVIIELIVYTIVRYTNKKFPWLIMKKDETPHLSKEGLTKFIPHGYDSELGWVRKPNSNNNEMGRNGTVTWHTNSKGSRMNPGFDDQESIISCYGDSFTFSRQVNDNETWEYFLSELMDTNVQNFGVGNYGIDQVLLRLKREFPKNKTNTVILAVVPDTISRIVSIWKHYYEYGNTFGFKPRFILEDNRLSLISNPIDDESKFEDYQKYLEKIRAHDYFYKNKFKKELLSFPYSFTIFKNFKRNLGIIFWILKINLNKDQTQIDPEISWKPMEIIMNINLKWRLKLFQDSNVQNLLKKIIEDYVEFSKEQKFDAVFTFLPQKDDILFIKNNYNFYEEFINELKTINDLKILDLTTPLLQEKDLSDLYSDLNDYGGHYSNIGNKKIASIIYEQLK